VWRTIPILEFLQERWGDMAVAPKFAEVSDSITSGLENIQKWYGKTDDTDAYFICLGTSINTNCRKGTNVLHLVLDPNVKDAYAENRWAPNFFKDGMTSLEKVVSCLDSWHFPSAKYSMSSINTFTQIPSL
jgi:hypothetical protein